MAFLLPKMMDDWSVVYFLHMQNQLPLMYRCLSSSTWRKRIIDYDLIEVPS